MKNIEKICIGVFALVIVLCLGFVTGFMSNDGKVDNNNDDKCVVEDRIDILSNSDPRVKLLSSIVGLTDADEDSVTTLKNLFHKSDKIDFENISLDDKLTLILKLKKYGNYEISDYEEKKGEAYCTYYPEENFKNIYNVLFGSDYKVGSPKWFGEYTLDYSEEKKAYYECILIGDDNIPGFISNSYYSYAEEIGDEINLFSLSLYKQFNYDDINLTKVFYYGDFDKKVELGSFLASQYFESDNKILNKYSDKLTKHKYTFVKNDEGNYLLKSIEKVK